MHIHNFRAGWSGVSQQCMGVVDEYVGFVEWLLARGKAALAPVEKTHVTYGFPWDRNRVSGWKASAYLHGLLSYVCLHFRDCTRNTNFFSEYTLLSCCCNLSLRTENLREEYVSWKHYEVTLHRNI
jgi:hypothetical protein